ncbi:hypothetical protein QHG78_02005 [Bacteroides sp. A1-P5]|uniref:Uncharacterized protein n=2 Tax=Bacteroides TaxID=816 RepID=A0ABU5HLC0_9BACE|nr:MULTISPECIES: hypothetical protein [unclassified Bacteroides]MDY7252039.1 hypothetical protein [Bacteroides sp. A1-P5]MDY7256494.1 hypothetical protein [Bacteroides sp. A2-P53]
MDDKKKQEELNSLIGKKEIAKVGNWYPNLYSQMSYSIADLQKEEQAVYDEIKELYANQGDLIVNEILKSIHHSFIFEFMDGDGNLGNGSEEVTITRKNLYDFSGDLYAKVDAVIHLKSALDHFNRIRELKYRIELTNKGILL